MKIYSDDTNLPYRSTTIKAIDSRRNIDGILARWGITKVMWTWDLPNNNVELVFELTSGFQDQKENPAVRIKPPTVWKKKKKRKIDEIDWKLSIRIFYWWIKNQLAMSYALQSEKILGFLPYIAVSHDKVLKDTIFANLNKLKQIEEKVLDAELDIVRT